MYLCTAFKVKVGRTPKRGLRGAKLLGNANNGDNAGSTYLNGNNEVTNANANRGAFLNKTQITKRVSRTHWSNIAEMTASLVTYKVSGIPVGRFCRLPQTPRPRPKSRQTLF